MDYCQEFEKLPTGVILCANDKDFTILKANSAAYDILGYTPEHLNDFRDNKFRNIVVDDFDDLFGTFRSSSGDIFDYDIRIKTMQEELRWVHNITRYDVESGIFYVTVSDVTENVMSSQLYLTLEEKLEEQTAINICLEALHDTSSEKNAMNRMLDVIMQYYSANGAYIFSRPKEDNSIDTIYDIIRDDYCVTAEKKETLPENFYNILFDRFKDCNEVQICSLQDCFNTDDELYSLFFENKIEKVLFAPVINHMGEKFAFVGVNNPKKFVKVFSLLRFISNFIADYIDKSRLFEQMQELSLYDSLTKLKNRHSYISKLEEIKKTAPSSLGVSYIDLNGLKIANDTKGHEFGDKLITTLSSLLKKYFEGEVYRIGGDEFVALCENMDREVFENKNQQLKFDMKADAIMDASIGFFWSDEKMDVLSQLEMAENLMYIEKQHYYEVSAMDRRRKK